MSKTTKKRSTTAVTRFSTGVNQIHPVVAVLRQHFPAEKAVWELCKISGLSESYSRKVLCGERQPNLELIVALLAQNYGREILFALVPKAGWIEKYQRLLDINDANRRLISAKQDIENLMAREAGR